MRAALALALALVACGSEPRPPDVLLITVDTLRADRLGAYGYRLETSPVLDALAARGVRFSDCTVQWPKTWPSMASLLTGAYPKTTGLGLTPHVIPESLTVLPEIFAAAGYRTGAVVANFNVGRTLGFQQGFEFFQESWQQKWQEQAGAQKFRNQPGRVKRFTNATLVDDQALAWLRTIPSDQRVFLWLHYMDPHGPYVPPEAYATRFLSDHPVEIVPLEKLPPYQRQNSRSGRTIRDLGFYRAQYDREVRYFDDELARLLDGLKALGRRDTLIVLTADHGESLGEQGYFLEHGKLPYQSTAHVPALIVRDGHVPAGRTVEQPVGLIDLAPTLVELAGLEPPAQFEGTSLVPLLQGDESAAPRHVFMESGYAEGEPQRTVREGRWKLIQVSSVEDRREMTGAAIELYDLEQDPGEQVNVASEHPDVVVRLVAALGHWAATGGELAQPGAERKPEALDPASREMLQALGYLEPEAAAADAPGGELQGAVLIVLDTLRADRLSISGYGRKTTPAIDALARRGVLFEQAVSGAPWTLPAMIGLVTGQRPSAAVYRGDRLQVSAVEALRRAGIRTAAFTEGGFVSAHFGFDLGFDEHHERATKVRLVADGRTDGEASLGIEDTFGAAMDWLDGVGGRRFFLLVHSYEPHSPYRDRRYAKGLEPGRLGRTFEQLDSERIHLGELALTAGELDYLSALYDGGVAASDREVGRLVGHLDALGLGGRVAVLLTADHGEDLGGRDPHHAGDHGHSLYDELLRIPLVIRDPRMGSPGARVASQVRLLDVMPTVLDLLGAPPRPEADGRSLLPLVRGEEHGDRVAFARVTRKGPRRISVRQDGYKLIRELSGTQPGRVELYRLADDPGERHDRSGEEPERLRALDAELENYRAELRRKGALDFGLERDAMPEALRNQLRALGYIR